MAKKKLRKLQDVADLLDRKLEIFNYAINSQLRSKATHQALADLVMEIKDAMGFSPIAVSQKPAEKDRD